MTGFEMVSTEGCAFEESNALETSAYIAIDLPENCVRPSLPGFTPDHRKLIIPNEGTDNICVFSLETLTFEHVIPLNRNSAPWQIKTIPNRPDLAYVSCSQFTGTFSGSPRTSGTLALVDVNRGRLLREIDVGAGANGVTVDRQSIHGYCVCIRDDAVTVIDVASHSVKARIPVGRAPAFAKLTLDGKYLVVTNLASASLSLIDTLTLSVLEEITVGVPDLCDSFPEWGPGDTTGIAISQDYKCYVTNYRSHSIVVFDINDRSVLSLPSPIRYPFFVEIDRATGLVLFSSGVEGRLAVLKPSTLEWVCVMPVDGTHKLPKPLDNLNLWMTQPSCNRITALLSRGLPGIAKFEKNMVTKFM